MKKNEHMKYALECEFESSLDNIMLKYCSLPSVNIENVDISTSFCGIDFKYPIYINAMTAGTKEADAINKSLEKISKSLDIFFFPGSFSPILEDDKLYYPKNYAVNLGADKNLYQMKKAISTTNAKILQIHLNPLQEYMMKSELNFSKWKSNIKSALENIDIPIIIKETGFGMSSDTIKTLVDMGVKCIDISSKGGSNFAYIEDRRLNKKRTHLYDFGYNLRQSLENSKKYINDVEILASGGINNSMDVVKCLAFGVKAVGISLYILKLLKEHSEDEVILILEEMIEEIKAIVAITDSKNLKELVGKWEEKC